MQGIQYASYSRLLLLLLYMRCTSSLYHFITALLLHFITSSLQLITYLHIVFLGVFLSFCFVDLT